VVSWLSWWPRAPTSDATAWPAFSVSEPIAPSFETTTGLPGRCTIAPWTGEETKRHRNGSGRAYRLRSRSVGKRAKIDLPLPPGESIPLAHRLIARRIRETPYKAYSWSLASDVFMHEAWQRRHTTVLDLTHLSEDPLENLLPEERDAIGALETANAPGTVEFTSTTIC